MSNCRNNLTREALFLWVLKIPISDVFLEDIVWMSLSITQPSSSQALQAGKLLEI